MIDDTSSASRGPQREPDREKFWRRTLRDFAASGQSIRAFCRERQLSEPSFYARRRALAERDAARAGKTDAPVFLPIRLACEDAAPIEIVFPGGHCIRLRPPIDRVALVEIVAALRLADATEA